MLINRAVAQKSPIEKVWYDEKKTCKIEIYKAIDNKYYGKMVWLNVPIDPATHQPQTDQHNPDEKLRNSPLKGLLVLKEFVQDPSDPNVLVSGTVYDADNGKTYCGKITLKDNSLDMRGCLCSLPIFGRTEKWTLAEGQ